MVGLYLYIICFVLSDTTQIRPRFSMENTPSSRIAAVRAYQARQEAADEAHFEYPALQVVCMRRRKPLGAHHCGLSVRPSCVAGACEDGGRITSCSWAPQLHYDHAAAVAALRKRLKQH